MAKLLRLDVAQLTDVGRKREHNEDNMAYVIPKDPQVMAYKGALFIVADGMGGHAAGEVASEIAVDTVSNAYYQDDSDDVAASLLQAIRRANAAIHQRASENMLRSGMGTTCVTAVLRGNMAYIANVGDSRAYLVRRSTLRQVSQDHSWVAEQVRAGLLTEEQARTHTQRNVITRSLGTQPEVEIDLFREVLEEGDTLLLCSDGLSGMVSDEELEQTAERFVPQESVYHLIERANENGGADNITAVIARVQELGVEPPGVRQPVSVGGPELSDEDTARLFAPVGAGISVAARNTGTLAPGSSLPHVSSPLTSAESDTSPQLTISKRRRNRLLAPTLTLVILFVLVVAGSGFYYFFHTNQAQTINSTLNDASHLISQANTQASRNPSQALQDLAQAQQKLQNLQKNYTLSDSAHTQLTNLQSQLVSETKTAITNYDQTAFITLLPCTTSTPSALTQGNAQTLALLQNSGGYYALGQDNKIYQLNSSGNSQYTLGNGFSLSNANSKITNIVGANTAIFALSQQTTNGTPGNYTINELTPGTGGALQQPTQTQTASIPAKDGQTPSLITAWNNGNGMNVYVVLISSSSETTATILSYSVDNKGSFSGPQTATISVSHPILSIAADADHLFMLLADGSLVSTPGNKISSPTSVLINQAIAAPLSAEAQNFTANTTVPAVTPIAQSGNSALTVPPPSSANPATLSTGTVKSANGAGQVHLFLSDSFNHRVLDLTQVLANAGGPGSTPTATATGNTLNNSVTLNLAHQYVSATYFNTIKSVAVDPNGGIINILGQSAAKGQNLVQASAGTQNACAA